MMPKSRPHLTCIGVLIALTCWCASNPSPAMADTTYNVFIVFGQSNAEGLDFADPKRTRKLGHQPLAPEPTDTDILLFASTDGKQRQGDWTTLKPSGNKYGPEIGLGRSLVANGWKNVAIVKLALGNTSMRQWLKDSPHDPQWAGVRIDLYENLIAQVRTAVDQLDTRNGGGNQVVLRGACWMQGEGDSSSGGEGDKYAGRLHQLVTDVRADLNTGESLRFVAGRTAITQPHRDDGLSRVRRAQVTVTDGTHPDFPLPNAAWVDVDDIARAAPGATIDNIDLPHGGLEDPQHFSPAGYLLLGRRWATALGGPR